MSDDAKALHEARALRTEAWALVRKDVETLRDGLSARPIGQRLKDRATDEVVEAIDTAKDVAAENKTVIGLTIAALAGWFLRRPIAGIAQNLAETVTEALDRR
ncbi:hypothetical protein OLX02_03110 [Novosphingobium sp. KCTC 2891]|uniref:hypothetical protein n=1 Tax=Novosphingobium sp. KCTC 2891 TaxID=2989730 RepID=UPI0022222FB3|nr:hypothetical protein [Novosphingobium sp. KCTC 2891]MCW1381806.1 hypothetical protein [Novosphingobium sp. KCTC 2891]